MRLLQARSEHSQLLLDVHATSVVGEAYNLIKFLQKRIHVVIIIGQRRPVQSRSNLNTSSDVVIAAVDLARLPLAQKPQHCRRDRSKSIHRVTSNGARLHDSRWGGV